MQRGTESALGQDEAAVVDGAEALAHQGFGSAVLDIEPDQLRLLTTDMPTEHEPRKATKASPW